MSTGPDLLTLQVCDTMLAESAKNSGGDILHKVSAMCELMALLQNFSSQSRFRLLLWKGFAEVQIERQNT